jgi:hypothetical protein
LVLSVQCESWWQNAAVCRPPRGATESGGKQRHQHADNQKDENVAPETGACGREGANAEGHDDLREGISVIGV